MQRRSILHISDSLVASFERTTSVVDAQPKKKMSIAERSNAYVQASKNQGRNVLSDDVILNVRRDKEMKNMKRKDILQNHNITADEYSRIISYQTRAHLVP